MWAFIGAKTVLGHYTVHSLRALHGLIQVTDQTDEVKWLAELWNSRICYIKLLIFNSKIWNFIMSLKTYFPVWLRISKIRLGTQFRFIHVFTHILILLKQWLIVVYKFLINLRHFQTLLKQWLSFTFFRSPVYWNRQGKSRQEHYSRVALECEQKQKNSSTCF